MLESRIQRLFGTQVMRAAEAELDDQDNRRRGEALRQLAQLENDGRAVLSKLAQEAAAAGQAVERAKAQLRAAEETQAQAIARHLVESTRLDRETDLVRKVLRDLEPSELRAFMAELRQNLDVARDWAAPQAPPVRVSMDESARLSRERYQAQIDRVESIRRAIAEANELIYTDAPNLRERIGAIRRRLEET